MRYVDFHFLDVGQGDCTIVEFPTRLTVVDINSCRTLAKESESELRARHRYSPPAPNPFLHGPFTAAAALLGGTRSPNLQALIEAAEAERKLQEAKNKLTNPIDYLKAWFPGQPIFRYIQTHPDMDHMAGLYRIAFEEGIQIVNFWDTSHCIEKDEAAMRTGAVNHDFRDWRAYLALRRRTSDPTVLRLTIGAQGDFYRQDCIHIWVPFDHKEQNNPDADPNDLSYVLCIQVGKCNIVMGGDATIETWKELYRRFCGSYGKMPKIHLLKASHHGRKSGYHVDSVRSMNPDLTVVSVGELKGKDDAAASYERFSNTGCFSTVDHGSMIARCWENGLVWLYDKDIKRIA
jgi:competence protein ComEC